MDPTAGMTETLDLHYGKGSGPSIATKLCCKQRGSHRDQEATNRGTGL